MEWISKQSWFNGDIYSIGASADGIDATMEIALKPKWLKGEWLIWTSYTGYPVCFPGGAYRKTLTDAWLKSNVRTQKAADKVISDVRAREAPSTWWNRLNM
jgi:predicted acyl esterase